MLLAYRPDIAGNRLSRPALYRSDSISCFSLETPTTPIAVEPSVLAQIRFGAAPDEGHDPRVIDTPIPVLEGWGAIETWRSRAAVRCGREDSIHFAEDGEVLFGHFEVAESRRDGLADAVAASYRRAFQFAAARGYGHILRMWNVVPNINQGDGDDERYKQFCIGRARVFDDVLAPASSQPAASCVGAAGDKVVVSFLCSIRPGVMLENPRQVRADHYPRSYGPRSPSFSRAVLFHWGDDVHLDISGTASIVGHATLHPGDPDRQLDETLRNIDALLQQVPERLDVRAPRLEEFSSLRVYVRHREHLDRIRAGLVTAIGADAPVVFLHADICRASLVLEVEGSWCTRDH